MEQLCKKVFDYKIETQKDIHKNVVIYHLVVMCIYIIKSEFFRIFKSIENNDFVQKCNKKLLELENKSIKLTLKLKRTLRNDIHNEFYKTSSEKWHQIKDL